MGECACVYVDSYDQPGIHESWMRKARKEHKCCECGRIIKKKEEYEIVQGNWAGIWENYKTCQECVEIRRVFFCDGWVYTRMFDDLYEYINELNGNVPEDCLSGLTPKSREIICQMIEDYWEGHLEEEDDY